MSHTRGPWKTGRQDGDDKEFQWVTDEASSPIDLGVARVYGDDSDNMKANARLIAAAPEMLTALEAALKGLRNYKHMNGLNIQQISEQIEDAIRQAKGEAL